MFVIKLYLVLLRLTLLNNKLIHTLVPITSNYNLYQRFSPDLNVSNIDPNVPMVYGNACVTSQYCQNDSEMYEMYDNDNTIDGYLRKLIADLKCANGCIMNQYTHSMSNVEDIIEEQVMRATLIILGERKHIENEIDYWMHES